MAEELRTATGKLAYLRVQGLGNGSGPPFDFIDVDVVIGIQGENVGFTLRNDDQRFARQGMLDVLRDAFNADTSVDVEYLVDPRDGTVTGKILRVTRRK